MEDTNLRNVGCGRRAEHGASGAARSLCLPAGGAGLPGLLPIDLEDLPGCLLLRPLGAHVPLPGADRRRSEWRSCSSGRRLCVSRHMPSRDLCLHQHLPEGGLTNARIDCRPCSAELFQPHPTKSYLYRNPRCTKQRHHCLRKHGQLEVQKGNASHDDLCRCWWERGYRPNDNRTQCTSLKGFAHDDNCLCVASDCRDGQKLNHVFKCIQVPSTTTTTNIPAQAAGDAAIRKTDMFTVIAITTLTSVTRILMHFLCA